MGIVAVEAVVARSIAGREVPVTGHAAVGAMVVVAGLGPMALPAQHDGVAQIDARAVSGVERALIASDVA